MLRNVRARSPAAYRSVFAGLAGSWPPAPFSWFRLMRGIIPLQSAAGQGLPAVLHGIPFTNCPAGPRTTPRRWPGIPEVSYRRTPMPLGRQGRGLDKCRARLLLPLRGSVLVDKACLDVDGSRDRDDQALPAVAETAKPRGPRAALFVCQAKSPLARCRGRPGPAPSGTPACRAKSPLARWSSVAAGNRS
jgi:hypothetical protein